MEEAKSVPMEEFLKAKHRDMAVGWLYRHPVFVRHMWETYGRRKLVNLKGFLLLTTALVSVPVIRQPASVTNATTSKESWVGKTAEEIVSDIKEFISAAEDDEIGVTA